MNLSLSPLNKPPSQRRLGETYMGWQVWWMCLWLYDALWDGHGMVIPSEVNVYITKWKITMLYGKTHYFDWAMFNSYVSHYQRVYDKERVSYTNHANSLGK